MARGVVRVGLLFPNNSPFSNVPLLIPSRSSKIPVIKIQEMLGLMEVLMALPEIHQTILSAYQLTPNSYTFTQLRYDLRKPRARVSLQCDGHRYAYCLREKAFASSSCSFSSINASVD